MTEYTLTVKETKNKAGRFHYQVWQLLEGKPSILVSERKSNREYVACTIDGVYYFGRLDLIGKGDHGRNIRFWQSREDGHARVNQLNIIAYKE